MAGARASSVAVVLVSGALLAHGLGCKSAEDKCEEARRAAKDGWNDYVAALEKTNADALRAQREAQQKLATDVERRLGPSAHKIAESRYDRGSPAWLRAYEIAYRETCNADPECSALTKQAMDAKQTLEDFRDRRVAARAALEAVYAAPEAARSAAAAAIVHPQYPQLKRAQALSNAAYEMCKALPSARKP